MVDLWRFVNISGKKWGTARMVEQPRAKITMLLGEYRHTIDEKGRIAIPAKLRKELGEGAVITRGTDRCLVMYPKKAWQAIVDKLATLPLSDSRARSFSRLMLAGAMEVVFDKQGRALVPTYLRSFANLATDAVLAGVYDRIELWDAAAWEAYKTHHSIDENLSEFGV